MGADAKRKEARKRKFDTQTFDTRSHDDIQSGMEGAQSPKKKQKQVPQSLERSESSPRTAEAEDAGDEETAKDADGEKVDEIAATQKAQRFIVFIGTFPFSRDRVCNLMSSDFHLGNLPYTATDSSIREQFAKVHPKSIRHRTEKGSGKSKGFAFLEFEGYDRMKTCLKLFHQMDFDDGLSPARKLNVELT